MKIAILILIIFVIIRQFIITKNQIIIIDNQNTITGNQVKIAKKLDEINIDIPEKVLEAYENEAKKQRMSRKALIEKTVIDKAPKNER